MNHEHHILAQWRASLGFFTCEQLGIFAKLTLNAYLITLKTLLKYFGWVFVAWLGLIYWPAFMESVNKLFAGMKPDTAMAFCSATINIFCPPVVFFVVCAARSSITRKHWYYFVSKMARFFVPFIFVAAFYSILIDYFIKVVDLTFWLQMVLELHLGLYMILFCFFYIDTRSMFKGLVGATRMMVYTYPVMIVMSLVAFSLFYLCLKSAAFFSIVLSNTALISLISALISWLFGSTMLVVMMSNIYIKHVYEYNKIYCPVP